MAPNDRGANPTPATLAFNTELTISNVSYTYPGTDRLVLEDINISIRRGQSIGLVGGSGAGKTTLIDILLGLLTPTQGSLAIEGTPLDTASASWKKLIGYVPQEISLIDDTVRRNIALGVPDAEIDDETINEALRLAALTEAIDQLPDGLDTFIGERGVRLSGGQRQRIGIARALYGGPEILIMDESTSSLDTATEREIINAIDSLRGDKTVIIIAHRLSTVRRCDQILFLKTGRLVDNGTFDEVRDRNADFARMVSLAEVSGDDSSLLADC